MMAKMQWIDPSVPGSFIYVSCSCFVLPYSVFVEGSVVDECCRLTVEYLLHVCSIFCRILFFEVCLRSNIPVTNVEELRPNLT
jgi:hypothetical protein